MSPPPPSDHGEHHFSHGMKRPLDTDFASPRSYISSPTSKRRNLSSNPSSPQYPFLTALRALHSDVNSSSPAASTDVLLSGSQLTPGALISISRDQSSVSLSPTAKRLVDSSVDGLEALVNSGKTIYGVNTGFGATSHTRTSDTFYLQSALLQMQQIGILPRDSSSRMPSSWVRGAMAIRINSLLRGHSAVRWEVLAQVSAMLNAKITPVVPLRGSISASGDLTPLAYIAGAASGYPGVFCTIGSSPTALPASEALRKHNLSLSLQYKAKEVLGLINGTAMTAAAATSVLYDSYNLTLLSLATTAMAVEASLGNTDSFDPFIASVRPHPGQIESGATILHLLSGSKLTKNRGRGATDPSALAQDRYPLRTASQWIGPTLEDLQLSLSQLTTELNSSTDNPLLEFPDGSTAPQVHHGGNFQAQHLTLLLDRTRMCLQHLGRLSFTQLTEMISYSTAPGLPPNLAPDDPSLSFPAKGLDIAAAAYCSELGTLAGPVSPHVQSAEGHNQAVNSLGLLSARKTAESVEVLGMLMASMIWCVCQVLDLRVLGGRVEFAIGDVVRDTMEKRFSESPAGKAVEKIVEVVQKEWAETSSLDLKERVGVTFEVAAKDLVWMILRDGVKMEDVEAWKSEATLEAENVVERMRREYYELIDSDSGMEGIMKELGLGAAAVYRFVRRELKVPMHRGKEDQPREGSEREAQKVTLGEMVTRVFEAVKDGRLSGVVLDALAGLEEKGRKGE